MTARFIFPGEEKLVPSNWPNWPTLASAEQRKQAEERKERARQHLIEEARLSAEQVRKIDAEFLEMNDGIAAAFDRLVAPLLQDGKGVPPENLREYKQLSGRIIETATNNVAAVVPGGRETLARVHFVIPGQLTLEVFQRLTALGDFERSQKR